MNCRTPNLNKDSILQTERNITDGEDQEFEISFVEWDFDKEEYYYFPMPDTFAGKIYEGKAKLIEPPKSTSEEVYENVIR